MLQSFIIFIIYLSRVPVHCLSVCVSQFVAELTKETRQKAGSLKMNTALEYSTRVVQEGGRRCKKSTLNDLVHLTPLRILNMPRGIEEGGIKDGEIREGEIGEEGREETFHCFIQTIEKCRFTVPSAVALLNYKGSGFYP
jgi:hypothetical protein